MVTNTPDKIFDVLKQWLRLGQDRSQFGLMEIRRRVTQPRKATTINDYHKAVAEWDRDVAKLKAYGGDLPNPQDLFVARKNLFDSNSHAYVVDEPNMWFRVVECGGVVTTLISLFIF